MSKLIQDFHAIVIWTSNPFRLRMQIDNYPGLSLYVC